LGMIALELSALQSVRKVDRPRATNADQGARGD